MWSPAQIASCSESGVSASRARRLAHTSWGGGAAFTFSVPIAILSNQPMSEAEGAQSSQAESIDITGEESQGLLYQGSTETSESSTPPTGGTAEAAAQEGTQESDGSSPPVSEASSSHSSEMMIMMMNLDSAYSDPSATESER